MMPISLINRSLVNLSIERDREVPDSRETTHPSLSLSPTIIDVGFLRLCAWCNDCSVCSPREVFIEVIQGRGLLPLKTLSESMLSKFYVIGKCFMALLRV